MAREEFTALLGSGTEYQGQLNFKGTVRVDGRFTGTITSEGKLILGKDAHIEGSVTVSELVVHGSLTGEMLVSKRTTLHQAARVSGSLTTPLLAMEEGALLQGELHMHKESGKSALNTASHSLRSAPESSVHELEAPVKQ